MKINFIGNYKQGPGGESADETHLTLELEKLDHTVYKVPRDVWKAYVDGYPVQADWVLPQEADITIICKWNHFNDEKYMAKLRELTKAPVFYWCWDPMIDDAPDDEGPDWHMMLAKNADLYLSGELGRTSYYRSKDIRYYYFQMDVVSKEFEAVQDLPKEYDVVFMGSSANKRDRLNLLKKIHLEQPIQVFGYDQMEWIRHGFKTAQPAVYGDAFNEVVAKSKIVIGVSYDPQCFGYWSNRVGRVLNAGGFLLQQYTPGMELFLADSAAYFQTADEAIMRIKEHLTLPERMADIKRNNVLLNRSRWTSQYKMRQLTVLMKRFLAENNGRDWLLP